MKKSIQTFVSPLIETLKQLVNVKKTLLFFAGISIVSLIIPNQLKGQSMLDLSVGISHQDNYFTNFAYRYQLSNKFRIGLEAQYGAPKYRFINAKPIRKGYTSTFSIPLTVRIYEKGQIRLDLYAKTGLRLQGIIDPDNNDKRDSILSSTSLAFEPGILVTVMLNNKINFQSGVTFPLVFQTSPSSIFENIYPGMLHAGLNYRSNENIIFFAKSLFGPGTGGDGDTQKFGWSLQTGVRFSFGNKPSSSFVEPSF